MLVFAKIEERAGVSTQSYFLRAGLIRPVLAVPLICGADAAFQSNAWPPAERAEAGNVKKLARRAVGLGAVEAEFAFVADDPFDNLGKLEDRDIGPGPDIYRNVRLDDIRLDDQIVIEEFRRSGAVGENSAYRRRGEKDGAGFVLSDPSLDIRLPAEIELRARRRDHLAIFRGKTANDGRADHAAVPSDIDLAP